MTQKNIAVIGCGYWGKNLVRNFFELDALYAVCDSDKERIALCREKYPDVVLYQDIESVLNNTDIKGVVISTPAVTHYDLTKQALLADKDVFVEKPIALHYNEGKELVTLAEAKEKIFMVGHILEYHPAIIKLKEMINKGELGHIQYIYSNRLNLGKFRTEENILWSFAPHDISVILSLLNEMPSEVSAHGANFLNKDIADITVTTMDFPSGAKAHIFVSWLHPYKEQKLIIIGGKKMIMFDDTRPEDKLLSFNHKIDWIDRKPVPHPENPIPIKINNGEPLKNECSHFIECISARKTPLTNGAKGLDVLKILETCQESMYSNGNDHYVTIKKDKNYFVHESSYIDDNVAIGKGTKIWHYSHVLGNSRIGEKCSIGQNCVIGPNVTIGNNVKIQNNVSVYDGVTLEDDVFCGPSMVFTNVINPRSHWPRKDEYKKTLVKKGASIGANATIVCGYTVGQYAFVGAGALVNKDVPDYALVYGSPAKVRGWMCYCGEKLEIKDSTSNQMACQNCKRKYQIEKNSIKEIE